MKYIKYIIIYLYQHKKVSFKMLRQKSHEIFLWHYMFVRALNLSFRQSCNLPVEDKFVFTGTVMQMQKCKSFPLHIKISLILIISVISVLLISITSHCKTV